MAKRQKRTVTVTVVNGIKYTVAGYQEPKDSERTYPVSKSRYTAWHQGVTRFENGSGGILGTVRD